MKIKSKSFYKILILLFLMPISKLYSQTESIECGTGLLHDYLMENNQDYQYLQEAQERSLQEFLANNPQFRNNNQTYTIPVVVHVFHLGEAVGTANNISDAQITGAIQGLNNRFANSSGLGADFNMQFCMAVRDPNNQPTNGIVRINASNVAGYAANGINYSSNLCGANENELKALSRWPVGNYYNIWVVNKICGGWAGYAYYPNGGVNDGTVIIRSQMTSSSTVLAHEIGHGFNLRHTFDGDASNTTCPTNNSCIDQGDRVCDTPPHKQSDCGTSNPCTTDGDWNNSRRNIMSYCGSLNRLTAGQRERSRASVVSTARIGLLSSNGCVPVTPRDAGIVQLIYPQGYTYQTHCESNEIVPKFSLRNFGTDTLFQIDLTYQILNEIIQNFTWNGSLAPNASVIIDLLPIEVNQLSNIFNLNIVGCNGSTDLFAANNSLSFPFEYRTLVPEYTTNAQFTNEGCLGAQNGSASFLVSSKYNIIEDFENNTAGWTLVNGAEPNQWMIGEATSNGGSRSIYISNNGISNDYSNTVSSTVHFYKDIYFPDWAENIRISFDWRNAGENNIDFFRVYLLNANVIPAAGSFPSGTIIGSTNYQNQPNFANTVIGNLQSHAGQTKRLVFTWRNNSISGDLPAAAIDNIVISFEANVGNIYQWSNGSTANNITSLSQGVYQVEVTNSQGCSIENQFEIGVLDSTLAPVIIASGELFFCEGESIVLKSTHLSPTIWSNGLVSDSIVVTQSGSYFTSINNPICPLRSDTLNVVVWPNPNIPIINLTNNLLSTDNYASFQWYLNGTQIDGANEQTLPITVFGSYAVEVTNEFGCKSVSEIFSFVGLNSLQNALDGNVFPNPSQGLIQFNFQKSVKQVVLINQLGKRWIFDQINQNTLHLSHLSSGVYVAEIEFISGEKRVGKLILLNN